MYSNDIQIPDEVRDALVFTCTHIIKGTEPCRLVTHNKSDCTWEFMCGKEGHTAADAVIVSAGELLKEDPTIADALCIKPDYYAQRTERGEKWISAPLDNTDEKED